MGWVSLWHMTRVFVLSFLGIVAGIVGGVGALTLFGLSNDAAHTSIFYANTMGVIGSVLLVIFGGFMLFTAALSLAFGVGIWTRSPRIWTLGVISQGFTLLLALGNLCNGALTSAQLMSIMLAGVILAILYTPSFQQSLAPQR